jgi:polar amino acid transport system substrate-binding protein
MAGKLVWFAVAMALVTRGAAAETLRVTTQAWPPYQTVIGGRLGGTAVAVVTCALDRLGHPYQITVYPWRRAQQAVATGSADAFFAASQSPERDRYARLSVTIAPQVWRWHWLSKYPPVLTDKGPRVAAVAGSRMNAWLVENGYVNTEAVEDMASAVALLRAGRVEAVLASEQAFASAASAHPAATFASAVHSDRPLGVYFGHGFLQRHPGFLERFNQAVPACRAG